MGYGLSRTTQRASTTIGTIGIAGGKGGTGARRGGGYALFGGSRGWHSRCKGFWGHQMELPASPSFKVPVAQRFWILDSQVTETN